MKNILLVICFISINANVNSQIITTVAGTGTRGYTGDNGPALTASFDHPDVVKFDKTGNMYIADEHNVVIRKIDISGIVTTKCSLF